MSGRASCALKQYYMAEDSRYTDDIRNPTNLAGLGTNAVTVLLKAGKTENGITRQ